MEEVEAWECVDSCPVRTLDEQSGPAGSNSLVSGAPASSGFLDGIGNNAHLDTRASGGASRFFYCAKASRAERNAGLDVLGCTCETNTGWENAGQPAAHQADTEASRQRDTGESSTADGSEWSTTLSGKLPTGRSPRDANSTIATETSSTIDSRTSNSSPILNTSDSTRRTTGSAAASGSGAARSADAGSQPPQSTTTSQPKDGSATDDAAPVTHEESSTASNVCEQCGGVVEGALRNSHPT
jgi:hypothetical protein